MGSQVWALCSQTHAHEPVGSHFLPINRSTGIKIDPRMYPNAVKTHQFSGTHCHL
jgi:hypothetical protein